MTKDVLLSQFVRSIAFCPVESTTRPLERGSAADLPKVQYLWKEMYRPLEETRLRKTKSRLAFRVLRSRLTKIFPLKAKDVQFATLLLLPLQTAFVRRSECMQLWNKQRCNPQNLNDSEYIISLGQQRSGNTYSQCVIRLWTD